MKLTLKWLYDGYMKYGYMKYDEPGQPGSVQVFMQQVPSS